MAIRHYEPWTLFNELNKELSRIYDGPSGTDTSSLATSDWAPAVDIREEPEHYVIEADLPGVTPEDIEINMDNGMLTIKGVREAQSRESEPNYKRTERAGGVFYRRFSLPDTADPERISARSELGVLRITIPKQERLQSRRIKVES